MPGFVSVRPVILFAGWVSMISVGAATAPQPASPATPPAVPFSVPPVLDEITFAVREEGENHKMVVIPAPGQLRVDEPDDGYSIIYNPATQFYIGLENRNYTYWEFSWPDVKAAIETTKRYETRVRDLGSTGLNGYLPDSDSAPLPGSNPATNFTASESFLDTNASVMTTPPAPAAPETNVSGYVWKPTTDKKRIAGFDCIRWTGESVSNDPAEAWCYAGMLPKVQDALRRVREINEPIALVPVRTLVPTIVFQVEDDLVRGGVTPLLIQWGSDQDKDHFELLSIKTRKGTPKLFGIPQLYVKTTLITMDGIGSQKVEGTQNPVTPQTGPRGAEGN